MVLTARRMTLTSHLSINDMKEVDKLDCLLPPENKPNVKSTSMFNSNSVEECKEKRNEHNLTKN